MGAPELNPVPALRRLDAVARDLGFPSSPALRKWCERHRVTLYKVGAVVFVDPAEIRRLIVGSARRTEDAPRNDDAAEIEAALAGPANRRRR
jgi:hypothetical protein